MNWRAGLAGVLAVLVCVPLAGNAQVRESTELPGGAHWSGERPANWNGTLLLFSRGYSGKPGAPQAAPEPYRQALLDAGYAIAGSDYGAGGWSLEQAVPAQRETIQAFATRYGKPKRVIAWGNSMGGLVTTALAEQPGSGIDAALPMCASIGGALGMMNMALDGAYAFRLLLGEGRGIQLVDIEDDAENAQQVRKALEQAMLSPEGRARVALAGVLAGIAGWTSPDRPEPKADNYRGQVEDIAAAFERGVFLPRVDQEKRAGGAFSWNSDVDYRKQLALSGRRALVDALYRQAGTDLEADLDRLAAGERVKAKPSAVAYMRNHYTPNARPLVPLAMVQKVGDGMTSPSLQRAYAEAAKGRDVRSLWVSAAGHCNFSTAVVLASVRYVESRIVTGRWGERPPLFTSFTPPPMLRPCVRGSKCR